MAFQTADVKSWTIYARLNRNDCPFAANPSFAVTIRMRDVSSQRYLTLKATGRQQTSQLLLRVRVDRPVSPHSAIASANDWRSLIRWRCEYRVVVPNFVSQDATSCLAEA